LRHALVVEGPDPVLDTLLAAHGIEVRRVDRVPDEGVLIDALRSSRAQVLFKRSRVPVTASVLEAAPDLLAVQLCCIGDDSVDLPAAASAGVLVFNDPVSNGRSVVELAVAQLVGGARGVVQADAATRAHGFDKGAAGRFEVLGKRLGIVGMGNIGRQVGRVAAALGMEVSFYDPRSVAVEVGEEMGMLPMRSLADLFRGSDLVSVHASARDADGQDNAGILDPVLGLLGEQRPASSPRVFVNLARGNLHSAEALIDAVRSGSIRRAAVDVYPHEPAPGVGWLNPYASEPAIACTPHIGAATEEAQPRIARRVATTIGRWSATGAVRDCVFAPRATLELGEAAPSGAILAVCHSVSRGTKKAVDDAIYEAEASNLGSVHRDFDIGMAVDLSSLDRDLPDRSLERLVARAAELSGDAGAVRSVRVIPGSARAGGR
jgi:D-3-phosphoglycerate dehydrogenase